MRQHIAKVTSQRRLAFFSVSWRTQSWLQRCLLFRSVIPSGRRFASDLR